MTIIGIDPGLNGGLAAIYDEGLPSVSVMPITGSGKGRELDLSTLAGWISDDVAKVYVEKVHAMPKQGVSSTFKFGVGYGSVLGVCAALHIPVVLVTPQEWKKTILRGLSWKGNKAASIQYCQRRWPEVSLLATKQSRKPHDGKADALCIAEYGWRQLF